MSSLIDYTDRAILTCLEQDARMSLKTLSGRIGLTSPSTAERLRRLEERGIIQGYSARINIAELGYSLQALAICIECDKVTGEDCFVARMVVRDIAHLDTELDQLAEMAQCNTSIIKSSPVTRRLPAL